MRKLELMESDGFDMTKAHDMNRRFESLSLNVQNENVDEGSSLYFSCVISLNTFRFEIGILISLIRSHIESVDYQKLVELSRDFLYN